MTVQPISLLPMLEPLGGISIAINLAYLNLTRFRYRKHIREQAKRLYADLESKAYFQVIRDLKQVAMLRDLSGLLDFDNLGSDPIEGQAEATPSDRKTLWVERLYKVVFEHHHDLKACRVFAGMAVLLVYFGVAHALGRHAYAAPLFDTVAKAHFWADALLVTILVPLGLVSLGNWIVGNLRAKAHEAFKEMEKIVGRLAEQAALQGDPPHAPIAG